MKHKEAFKIMSYRCECGSQEKLWNSRDGVTPFTIPCGQCGNGMGMVHVDWDHDVFAPFLNPPAGSRYFADMTIERARQYAVRNVDSLISMGRVEETRRNELIRSLTQNYFGDGHAPDILVAQVGQDAKPAKCDGNHETATRDMLDSAQAKRGAVPEGERAAFESWIENEAGPGAARRWMNTEAYENGRVQDYRTGWVACLEWLPAAPSACMTCNGHGMIGGLLPNGGGYQADPCPDCAAPVTAGVPMPKPVAYGFGNTAITGHTNRLMMVRIDIPGGDQYAGAFWLPLVLADEAHTYGVACRAAGEAAGYAQGLRDAVRDAAPLVQNGEVLVTVTGLTGSGKSAIAGEIEIMCRALGLEVEWGEGAAEKHLTHADWTNALEMYRPRVRIVEANIPRTDAALRGEVK